MSLYLLYGVRRHTRCPVVNVVQTCRLPVLLVNNSLNLSSFQAHALFRRKQTNNKSTILGQNLPINTKNDDPTKEDWGGGRWEKERSEARRVGKGWASTCRSR